VDVLLLDSPSGTLAPVVAALARREPLLIACEPAAALERARDARPSSLIITSALLESPSADAFLVAIRALRPGIATIACGDFPDPLRAREQIERFTLHGVHRPGDSPERLLELVAGGRAAARVAASGRVPRDLGALVVARLCHELRNSLHVIQGYTEILRLETPPGSDAEVLPRLAAVSDSAVALVCDYLELARLDAAPPELVLEPVALEALVDEVRRGAERGIASRPIRIVTSASPRGATIVTDRGLLRRVLHELLANAIKFTPGGTIGVLARVCGGTAEFVVDDEGAGLRADGGSARAFVQDGSLGLSCTPGQGIGLELAKRMAARIGGTIETTGTGDGTTSTLRLSAGADAQASAVIHPTVH